MIHGAAGMIGDVSPAPPACLSALLSRPPPRLKSACRTVNKAFAVHNRRASPRQACVRTARSCVQACHGALRNTEALSAAEAVAPPYDPHCFGHVSFPLPSPEESIRRGCSVQRRQRPLRPPCKRHAHPIVGSGHRSCRPDKGQASLPPAVLGRLIKSYSDSSPMQAFISSDIFQASA